MKVLLNTAVEDSNLLDPAFADRWDTLDEERVRRCRGFSEEDLDFYAEQIVKECFKDIIRADRVRLLEELLHNTYSVGDCLIWRGCYGPTGYGRVTKSKYGHGSAHVAAYYLWNFNSKVDHPPGVYILHSCNNKGCINPNHLREGTAKDNADDLKKYRQRMSGHTLLP